MRRYGREQHAPRMFRGAELLRLMTGILMLIVICMLMMRFRDPGVWRWLVHNGEKPAESAQTAGPKTPQPTPPVPAATGPTDEDTEQVEEATQEFQAITDGTLRLGPEEMVAYNRLVEWVKNQSFSRLYQRARKGLWYTHLYDDAEKRRGELVALDLEVLLASDAGKNDYGIQLYEAWGTTDESRGRLYSLIVVDYPRGMPVGYDIRAKAKFAGYFLKLQGYEPGSAKPGQAPDKAPLLIGRLQWEPTAVATPPIDDTQEWIWGLSVLAVIGVALGLRLVYYKWVRRKPAARPMIPDAATGEVIPIEAWLERSNFNAVDRDGVDGGATEDR